MTSQTDANEAASRARQGLLAGMGAYLLWGFLPLLFAALEHTGPVLVVAWRTLFSLVLVAVLLSAMRNWGEVRSALTERKTLLFMLASSVLLATNWLIYVYGVVSHQTLEASFGYYINPMVNVAIGMLLLGERQNPVQLFAIGLGLVAIVMQAWGIGGVPVIALGVAVSFAFYGYFRKTTRLGSTAGLFVETLLLTPAALAAVLVLGLAGPGWGFSNPGELGLLMLTGPATAIPLLLFAYAVRRLRLTTIGMLQYMGPTIQFVLAVLVLGETLTPLRLVSFGMIWLAVGIYTADSILRRRR